MTTDTPVVIAGAGPTGLVLALSLARRGIPFRVIDDDPRPGAHSRAMAVHAKPRTIAHRTSSRR